MRGATPSSSRSSRASACFADSPHSMCPPGKYTLPLRRFLQSRICAFFMHTPRARSSIFRFLFMRDSAVRKDLELKRALHQVQSEGSRGGSRIKCPLPGQAAAPRPVFPTNPNSRTARPPSLPISRAYSRKFVRRLPTDAKLHRPNKATRQYRPHRRAPAPIPAPLRKLFSHPPGR